MIGERLAHRVAAREGAHLAGLFSRLFCGQGILGCRRFQFFKLQFQLINQPRAPFRRDAEFVAAQLGNLKLEFLDHRFRAGHDGAGLCQFAFRNLCAGLRSGQGSA